MRVLVRWRVGSDMLVDQAFRIRNVATTA